jgi:hypothetical protein
MANEIKVKVSGDNQLGSSLKQAEGQLNSFGKVVGSVGTAIKALGIGLIVKQLVDFASSTVSMADNLNKMSQRTGVSVEELSGLAHAAELSDVGVDGLEKSLKKLSVTMSDAAAGNKEARDNLASLGASATDANGKMRPTSDVLAQIADRLSKAKDGAEKTALAVKVFGKSGSDMIPMLNQGSAGLKAMQEEAQRLGLVLSKDDAQAAEDLKDNFTRLTNAVQGLMLHFMSGLMPALERVYNSMTGPGQMAFDAAKKGGEALGFVIKSLVLAFEALGVGVAWSVHKIGLFGEAVAALASLDTKTAGEKIKQLFGTTPDAQAQALWEQLSQAKRALFNGADPSSGAPSAAGGGGGSDLTRRAIDQDAIDKARLKNRLDGEKLGADLIKSLNDQEFQRLDELRQHDLVSIEDYYARRKELTMSSLQAEIQALDAEKQEMEKQSQKGEQKDRIAALGRVYELEVQILEKENQLKAVQGQTVTGSPDQLAQRAEQMEIAAAKAQEIERKIQAIYSDLETETARIESMVANHQLSELEGEKALNQARAEARDKVSGLADDYARVAQESGNPEIVSNAKRIEEQTRQLGIAAHQMRDEFISATQNGFETMFSSIMTGSQSAGAAFKNFASTVLSAISSMIAKMIAMYIVQRLIGFVIGGVSGTPTSIGSGASAGLGGVIGAGGGGIGSGLSLAPRASGGPVSSGTPYMIGEQGPELFVPGSSGTVIANNKLKTGGRGGDVYIDARGADEGVYQRMVALMRQTHKLSVIGAFTAVSQDQQRR